VKYPVGGYRTAAARAFNGPAAPAGPVYLDDLAADFAEVLRQPLARSDEGWINDLLRQPLQKADDISDVADILKQPLRRADAPSPMPALPVALQDLAEAVAGLETGAGLGVAEQALADAASGRLGDALALAGLLGYAEWGALWAAGVDIPFGQWIHAPGFVQTLDCGGSEDMISDAILACGTPQTPPRPGTPGFILSFPRHDYATYDIADPPANPIHNADTFNATVKAVWTHPTVGDAPMVVVPFASRKDPEDYKKRPVAFLPPWLDPLNSEPGLARDVPPTWRQAAAMRPGGNPNRVEDRKLANSLRQVAQTLNNPLFAPKPGTKGFGGGGASGGWKPTPQKPTGPGKPSWAGRPPMGPGDDPDPDSDHPHWWWLFFGGGKPPPVPPTNSPPGPGETELKIWMDGKAYKVFKRAVNAATETADMLEALYHSLPEELQTGRSFVEDLNILFKNFAEISVGAAVLNLLRNELEDRLIGQLARRTNKNFRPHYRRTNRPVGFFAGPAL